MNDKKELETFALTGIYLVYLIIILIINNGSIFNNYFYIPTIIFTCLFGGLIKIDITKLDSFFEMLLKFCNSIITIILILLAFVLVEAKGIIEKNSQGDALLSVGWIVIFLFGTYLFSLVGNHLKEEYKEIMGRISFLIFLMTFLILISFIVSLTFSNV